MGGRHYSTNIGGCITHSCLYHNNATRKSMEMIGIEMARSDGMLHAEWSRRSVTSRT
jgi:hypothetical protein